MSGSRPGRGGVDGGGKGLGQCAGAAQDRQAGRLEEIAHLAEAFRAAGDVDEKGRCGVARPQGADRVEIDRVLALDRAGDRDDAAVGRADPVARGRPGLEKCGRNGLLEAQFPRDMDVRHANGGEAVGLKVGFHESPGEGAHHLLPQTRPAAVAGDGFRWILRVAHEKRNAGGLRGIDHARPDLDLHDKAEGGAERREEAAVGGLRLERHPDGGEAAGGDLGREDPFGLAPAGGGEKGDDDAVAPVEKGADQRNGRAHLAQRYGVNPDGAGQGDRIVSQTFVDMVCIERVLPAPAAQVGQDQRPTRRPEKRPDAKKEAHPEAHARGPMSARRSAASGSSAPRAPSTRLRARWAISARSGARRASASAPGATSRAAPAACRAA